MHTNDTNENRIRIISINYRTSIYESEGEEENEVLFA